MAKKEKLSVESYKGVRDFYPEDQALLTYIFTTMREAVQRFGYAEYHASILEPAELYRSKGAENAEMVNEQTYTFTDRGGREVTLRPEMTPSVARMVAARRREMGFPLRLFSIPNLFRYERPQRGRLREHWQLNVDLFGSVSPAADAEIIAVAHAVITAFGAEEKDFIIRVGSRTFLNELVEKLGLSPDHAAAMRTALDRRAKMPAEEFESIMNGLGIPLSAFEADAVPHDVAAVLELLADLGLSNAVFDSSIVRGFDYYTGIVFEVFDTHPDNNRSLFGGGRYDNLLALFDEETVPAVGFGMGDVTIRDFLEVRGLTPTYRPAAQAYIAIADEKNIPDALKIAEDLRQSGVNVAADFGEKKLSDQIKAASKNKIPHLIVVGSDELQSNNFSVRDLATGEEKQLSRAELAAFFLNLK